MSIRENAVIGRAGSFIFNCDGEYTLDDSSKGIDGNHSHTSLRQVQKAVDPENLQSSAVLSGNLELKDNIKESLADAKGLYPMDDFNIHVYTPVLRVASLHA
jgi:hypothetical protein